MTGFLLPLFLQEALEDKLRAVDAKEAEVRQLRTALRDRDRDLERAQSTVLNNEDKINVMNHCCHNIIKIIIIIITTSFYIALLTPEKRQALQTLLTLVTGL